VIVLFDDNRIFKNNVDCVILRNNKEAKEWMKTLEKDQIIDQLWLDHDLGVVNGKIETTIPFVNKLEKLFIKENPLAIKEVIVHTTNIVGGERIMKSLKPLYKTIRVPASDYLKVDWPIRIL